MTLPGRTALFLSLQFRFYRFFIAVHDLYVSAPLLLL